jgi:hypothetical protein
MKNCILSIFRRMFGKPMQPKLPAPYAWRENASNMQTLREVCAQQKGKKCESMFDTMQAEREEIETLIHASYTGASIMAQTPPVRHSQQNNHRR